MLILKRSTIYHPNKHCQPYTNIAAKSLHCSHWGIRRLVLALCLFFFTIGIAAKGEHAQYTNLLIDSAFIANDSAFIANAISDSANLTFLQPDSLGVLPAKKHTLYHLDRVHLGRGITYVGIPLVIAGVFGKSERHRVYYLHNDFSPKFKTWVDDYLQFAPAALATGLKVMGLPGKSSNVRYLASSGFSFFIMAAFVNSIKYTANQMRPDNSTRNSFPSGHTATAFVAATILHKEYGATISPLYSIAGYGAATATGIMRMLNNRHWMSDVFCGAGIGIMSTELGYLVSDMLFKDKGLIRPDKEEMVDLRTRPSFFSIRVGGVLGQQKLAMPESFKEILGQHQLLMQFGTASVVGVEAAYFLTPHIGFGTSWQLVGHHVKRLDRIFKEPSATANFPSNTVFSFPRTGINELCASAGLYLSLPFSQRWAMGGKLTVGRNNIKDITVTANKAGIMASVEPKDTYYNFRPYSASWNFLTIHGNKALLLGTGLWCTMAYKQNYCWRAYVDFNYSRNKFTATLDPHGWEKQVYTSTKLGNESISETIKKNMVQIGAGTVFSISF